jgi:hypothetical protein
MAIAAGGAIVAGLMTAAQVYLSMLGHGHSFARLVIWQLGSSAVWAVAAPWVLGLAIRRVRLRLLIPLGVLLFAMHIVVATEVTAYIHPFAIGGGMDGREDVPYPFMGSLSLSVPYIALVDPVLYALLIVAGRAVAAREQAWRLRLRESQLESEVTRAQLDALRLEIEPHFLFNTLNSIAAMIRLKDHEGALSMLLGLSDLMRSTLDRTAGHYTALAEEVAMARRYIAIQQTRFADRLVVSYAIDPACLDVAVPAFVLQPIVENALRHGLMGHARGGTLEIGAARTNGRIRLWVRDNGARLLPGFDIRTHAGTGLRNIATRLERIYGDDASLTVRAEGSATVAELVLPATPQAEVVPA